MMGRERREERKIIPSLMATSLRWRMHSARTNNFDHIYIVQGAMNVTKNSDVTKGHKRLVKYQKSTFDEGRIICGMRTQQRRQ
jgi:hypothetical protein